MKLSRYNNDTLCVAVWADYPEPLQPILRDRVKTVPRRSKYRKLPRETIQIEWFPGEFCYLPYRMSLHATRSQPISMKSAISMSPVRTGADTVNPASCAIASMSSSRGIGRLVLTGSM